MRDGVRCLQAGLLAGAGIEELSYQIRVRTGVAVRGRRRDGVAVGQPNFMDKSLHMM